MKNLILIGIVLVGFLPCKAQHYNNEERANYNKLEDRLRWLEAYHKQQIEFLQAQILLLSAKDTTRQKQLLNTLQFYINQIDKKYTEEVEELKRTKDGRKNETEQIIKEYTSFFKEQINQQASMLVYGILGVVVLCILLFFIALKIFIDYQDRHLRILLHEQEEQVKSLLAVSLAEVIQKELSAKYPVTQEDELVAELKSRIAFLEEEILFQKQEIKKLESEIERRDSAVLINDSENENIQIQDQPSSDVESTLKNKQETKEETSSTSFTNNRVWVDAIEQKISQSLKEEEINRESEEIVEETIYEKDTLSDVPAVEIQNADNIKEYCDQSESEYDALIAQAMSAYENKNYHEAIRLYTKAIEIKPDYLSYTRRANCYHILKKYDQAAEDYERAIRLKNDFIPAYNNAIEIYILTDNFFQALTLLERLAPIEKSHSYKAVELYLKLIAQKGLMQNTEKTERELDELLRENFTFNFSVKEIEEWLMTADMDPTDKKLIRVKTELLKLKREYVTVA